MSKLPSRGPRVMHGVGKLLAQARSLPPAKQSQLAAQALIGPRAQAALQQVGDVRVLAERCVAAETKLNNVQMVIASFEDQMAKVAPEHPARKLGEQIINTFKEVLK